MEALMSMTVGALQTELAKLEPQAGLMLAVNGIFVPVIGVTGAGGTTFAVIRGKGKLNQSSRFTIDEEGLLGHLARLGVSDEEIGEVLGRPAHSIKRKRKALGKQ
jgi:hypothetical protein